MTTAFAHAVRGNIVAAARAQVLGLVLAVATAGTAMLAGLALVTGRRPDVNWYRINPTHVVWWTALAAVLAWGLKLVVGLADGTLPAW
jgi:hypothetical protein